MSTSPSPVPAATAAVLADIDEACARIAPTWPLDRFIAVNPYWGWRHHDIEDAAARLGTLSGTALTMPRAWFRREWAAGRLDLDLLDEVASECGDPGLAGVARAVLADAEAPIDAVRRRRPLVTDLRDAGRAPLPGTTWTDHVVHQIGQHLAGLVDDGQSTWHPTHGLDAYRAWRDDPATPRSLRISSNRSQVVSLIRSLPGSATAAIAQLLDDLAVPRSARASYLTALLLSVNGWAAWCAFRRWDARLEGGDDDSIVDLLAVRLAWEWMLSCDVPVADLTAWALSWDAADAAVEEMATAQRVDWVLQAAVERAYQRGLAISLPFAPLDERAEVDVEAVFCIDVRSEVFRRALEASSPRVRTRGFAGFFGLPIAYTPAGGHLTRPQLPGLLAPALHVSEVAPADEPVARARRDRSLGAAQVWDAFSHTPASVFAFVESTGVLGAIDLVRSGRASTSRPENWEHAGADARLTPRLALVDDDPDTAAEVARTVLTNMGLLGDGATFARVVLLCGHGSHTTNNPHAAGLDCGACGGQTGEVNVRALADLLNDPVVRDRLAARGVNIPAGTRFVPALHETTTDTVTLFDTDDQEATDLVASLADLRGWLRDAGARARAERSVRLGLGALSGEPVALERAIRERANDWSQVRPEWGLADNAAFVVAPRSRTRHLDLEGRAFLHDYDWRRDTDLSVLTLIMTAPMVVTNWINMQYLASTVDNVRYGSGDKVLHNVVGGHIGVFEGNGGDLRIGLPVQSLHDGRVLRHRPLRLSVFIEAPAENIERVMADHEVVRQLIANGWLHLLRIDPETGRTERRVGEAWRPVLS